MLNSMHIPKKRYMHIITISLLNPPKVPFYNSLSLRSHSTMAGARGLENKLV
jgi:hypothetical protein